MSASSSPLGLSVLADLDDDIFGSWTPTGPGAGRSLSTPPPPVTVPSGSTIGVGTRATMAPSNASMGVGTTLALGQLAEY